MRCWLITIAAQLCCSSDGISVHFNCTCTHYNEACRAHWLSSLQVLHQILPFLPPGVDMHNRWPRERLRADWLASCHISGSQLAMKHLGRLLHFSPTEQTPLLAISTSYKQIPSPPFSSLSNCSEEVAQPACNACHTHGDSSSSRRS